MASPSFRRAVVTVLLAGSWVGVGIARQGRHDGVIAGVGKGRIQIQSAAESGKPAPKPEWFVLLPTTKVLRGDAAVAIVDISFRKGERASVIVAAGDEAGTEWTCVMHPEVAAAAAGSCPTCRMKLTARTRPAKASEVHLDAR